jgi:hypothetical protein
LIYIIKHLKLDNIISQDYLDKNDPVLIKLQLWLEERSSDYQFLHSLDPNNDLITLENMSKGEFFSTRRYFNNP